MQRSYHIQTVIALLALCAVAWMMAQPQSATPAYAQGPPPPAPTATPPGPPLLPDGGHPCEGDVAISGKVVDTNGNPIAGARIRLDELQLPNLGREATSCTMANTDENGAFVITEFRATQWMLVVEPPVDDETLFETPDFYLALDEGDTIKIEEPFILTDAQVTATSMGQDGVTPMHSKYHLYQPLDFNDDGEVACYLSTPDVERIFDLVYFDLEDRAESSRYIAFDTYTEADGAIKLGSLPEGDYCLRVQVFDFSVAPESYPFFPIIEEEISVTADGTTVDLGALVPAPTPKRLTITTITEDGDIVADVLLSVFNQTPPSGGAYGRTDANGNISFDLVSGTWGIYEQETEGSLFDRYNPPLREVTFAQNENTEALDVTITVDAVEPSPIAKLQGTVRKPDGSLAIGAEGTISLSSGTPGADDWQWQNVIIDPDTATFEAIVSSGTWQLTYSLHVYSADDEYAAFKPIGRSATVLFNANETVEYDMMLIGFDSALRGSVLKPDGTTLNAGRVWVGDGAFTRRPVEIVDGVFETQLMAGTEYRIAVDDEAGTLAADGYGVPAIYRVTASPNSPAEIELQLLTLDAEITGTVYREDADLRVPVPKTEVYATTADGRCIHAVTDENGQYTLAVPSGTEWEVKAYWQELIEGKFYNSGDKIKVSVVDPQAYTLDLAVKPVTFLLPPELDETFDVSEAWTGTLSDGTMLEIPANAVPVVDQDGDDVRIVVQPVTNSLPRDFDVEIVKYGYEIQLFDARSGEQILSELDQHITLTYTYDDELLADMNSDESSLAVSTRSGDGQTWQNVQTVNHNANTNVLSISLDQPTAAAVTVRTQRDQADDSATSEQTDALIFPTSVSQIVSVSTKSKTLRSSD